MMGKGAPPEKKDARLLYVRNVNISHSKDKWFDKFFHISFSTNYVWKSNSKMLNGFRILMLIVFLLGLVLIYGYQYLTFGAASTKRSSTSIMQSELIYNFTSINIEPKL